MHKSISAVILAGHLWAAAPVIAEDAVTLEPVIVSATRTGSAVTNTATGITVISREQIDARGAADVADVLRGYGGVQVSDLFGDGSRPTISLRGFGGNAQNNTLIMVDGRRLNNSDQGAPDLSTIQLQDVERIEIVQGSAATLYGDQAVGGVINIITRTPTRLRGSVRAAAGTDEYRSAIVDIEDRLANGLGMRLSAAARHADNYRYQNDLEYHSLGGKIDYRRDWGEAYFEYQDMREDLETPGGLFLDQIAVNRRQALNPGDFIDTDTQAARAGLVVHLPRSWRFETEITNRYSDGEGIQSVVGTPSDVLTKRHHREFTPRVVREWQGTHGTAVFAAGADVFWTDYRLVSDIGVTDDVQTSYAGYVRLVWPIASRLTVTTGHRQARVNNDLFVSNVFQGVLLPEGSEVDDDAGASELGLSFDLAPKWRLYGRVERNYRFVNADEYGSAAGAFPVPTTPVTQTGRSAEIGSAWQGSRLAAQVGVYQLDLENEIEFDPIRFINTNIGETRRRGAFIDGAWSPFEALTFSAHYGYVDARIVSGPLADRSVPFVAEHTFLVGADLGFAPAVTLHLEAVGTSERSAVGDFDEAFPGAPGYVIANANLRWRWRFLEADLRVGNLLDKEYVDNAQLGVRPPLFATETVRFPSPERTLMLTVGLHYE
ncbi:MAG: Vitamin B12 transporter BtuB [Gammaproteobacteria bacterium]|nr:Vitamin B12 transporter BtuB [Gammaproteobacteria bacterium]